MPGIDKITERIISDANEEVVRIQTDSASECAAIAIKFSEQAEAEAAALINAGREEALRRVERLSNAAKTEAQKSLLSEKQTLINEAFELAERKLAAEPDDGKAFHVQLVLSDGTKTSKRDIAMALERLRGELTPKVAEILFADAN
jgi:V/A-type H+-transporting ATPase subunit E